MELESLKDNLRIKIFNEVLNQVPLDSILQVDNTMLDHCLNLYSGKLKKLFNFQIEDIDNQYHDYCFLLTEESVSLLRDLSQNYFILDIFVFYRIYNKEKTNVFLLVYDTDYYEVSGKLNIEKTIIDEWNSMQGRGGYFSMADEIPYTKDMVI